MARREPHKLDKMPDTGRVACGHPSQERAVIKIARENLCDYYLSPNSPPGNAYIMNLDQVFAPPLSALWLERDNDFDPVTLRERWWFPDS